MNSDDTKYSTDSGGAPSDDVVSLDEPLDGYPVTGPIVLGSYSVVVLSQQRRRVRAHLGRAS